MKLHPSNYGTLPVEASPLAPNVEPPLPGQGWFGIAKRICLPESACESVRSEVRSLNVPARVDIPIAQFSPELMAELGAVRARIAREGGPR